MTTSATPQTFTFMGDLSIRMLMIENSPWFIAADICKALGLSNPTEAIKSLDADEQALSSIEGLSRGNNQANIVNESGMYALIFKSRKAIAKQFRKWVTSEVLPSIRETGGYGGHFAHEAGPEPAAKLTHLPKTSRAGLHQSISQVVSTVEGVSYPLVYRYLHAELGVSHLSDMTLEQIEAAIEILKREYGARCGSGLVISEHILVRRQRLLNVLSYSLSLAEECMLIHGALRSLGYQRHGQFVGLAKEVQLVGGILAGENGLDPKIMV